MDKEEHKFWKTQPVMDPKAERKEGPLSFPKVEEISQKSQPLPEDLEWCTVDVTCESQMKELYTLLSNNYVEDTDTMFRFDYSVEFLNWALKPPHWEAEWHVGVRVAGTQKLVAFISGIPVSMNLRSRNVKMVEINYLCVHKDLRSKRLAPILIKEVTRRINLKGIFQAVYTAGIKIPTPFTVSTYYHRPLNVRKCVETGFSQLPPGMDLNRLQLRYKLAPSVGGLPMLRQLRKNDLPYVRKRLNYFLKSFISAPEFSLEEMEHWFMPKENVVYSYVSEDPKTTKVTSFVSFYSLPSSVINNSLHTHLRAAYLFYYFADVEQKENEPAEQLRARKEAAIQQLMRALLIAALNQGFDVMNCLDILYNSSFLEPLKFGKGDGSLHYYLYNYHQRRLEPSECGLVML